MTTVTSPAVTSSTTASSTTAASPDHATSNGKATAALVLGLLCFVAGFFAGIPALVFGILGLRRSKEIGGVGKGQSIFGIIMGSLVSVSWIVLILVMTTR